MNRPVIVALSLSALALVMSLAVLAYAGTKNGDRVHDIAHVVARVQESRLDATEQDCQLRNAQSRTIIWFVTSLAPRLGGQVRRAFVVEPDCHAYALERVRVKGASPRR